MLIIVIRIVSFKSETGFPYLTLHDFLIPAVKRGPFCMNINGIRCLQSEQFINVPIGVMKIISSRLPYNVFFGNNDGVFQQFPEPLIIVFIAVQINIHLSAKESVNQPGGFRFKHHFSVFFFRPLVILFNDQHFSFVMIEYNQTLISSEQSFNVFIMLPEGNHSLRDLAASDNGINIS